MLGMELAWITVPHLKLIPLGRAELDIVNEQQCKKVLKELRPDAIIHCAAYTAVDQAESDPDEAYLINEAGARNIAEAAEAIGAKLFYVSTDYVFDGQAKRPYLPADMTNPMTVYGKSKLAGENAVRETLERHFIVRTSWLYGHHGGNFVDTMLRLADSGKPIRVVDDQFGSPTYCYDLAKLLLELVQSEAYGIYHATGAGSCSWYEFAKAIFEISEKQVDLSPCSTSDFPRPAPRPEYSVLDGSELETRGFHRLRHWREALRHYLHTR